MFNLLSLERSKRHVLSEASWLSWRPVFLFSACSAFDERSKRHVLSEASWPSPWPVFLFSACSAFDFLDRRLAAQRTTAKLPAARRTVAQRPVVRFQRLNGSRLNALRLRFLRSGGLARRLEATLPAVRRPGGCGSAVHVSARRGYVFCGPALAF